MTQPEITQTTSKPVDLVAGLGEIWRNVFGSSPEPTALLTDDVQAQSVKLIEFVVRVQERFGVTLELESLLGSTTLATLATEISQVQQERR